MTRIVLDEAVLAVCPHMQCNAIKSYRICGCVSERAASYACIMYVYVYLDRWLPTYSMRIAFITSQAKRHKCLGC